MNKKLICLTMSILMLLACLFTSCSGVKTEEEDSGVDNSAKTITMWVITDDATTDTAKEKVNEEFTKITKAKFKTNVVIKFCTEDEYYEKLEGTIRAAQADIELEEEASKELRKYLKAHKGEKSPEELTKDFYIENPQYAKFQDVEEEDEDAPVTEEETFKNDFGITEIKYPEEQENQVDIFYLSGYDKYMQYYNDEWLSSLSEELNTASKKMTDYISTSLLNGVQIEGGVYAIPNNVPIGEYTYMMIDKTLFDRYYQKIDKVNSVLDLATFLNDVKNENGDKSVDDADYIVPLASTYEECLKMVCWYWDLSYTDQSVYETYFDAETGRNYVVKTQFEIKVEGEDGEETKTAIVDTVKPDVVYKTNEKGQFLDAEGNVLNYRYETDAENGWIYDAKKEKYTFSANAAGALYLVDENGHTVKAEDDKRVVIDGETKLDADGNPRPTYRYHINRDADFSILGTMMKDAKSRTRGGINLDFTSLFTSSEYHELYATLKDYDYQGYYGEVKEGQKAAVSFLKGDATIKLAAAANKNVYIDESGKEFYAVIAEYPEATEKELYGNMYAVYANSNNLARSMKVITLLNTNKELRDLLQYGIKGEHYELNDDGTVHLLSHKDNIYRMDIEKTGNCFIATPDEARGVGAWETAKLQNNDSLINPLLGFDFNTATADSDYSLDVALIDRIKEMNAEALLLIDECTNKSELMELMSNTDDGLVRKYSSSADEKLKKALSSTYDPEAPLGPGVPDQMPDKSGSSPFTVYKTWLTTYGYAYVPSTSD